jgi:hypothetical protein
MIIENLLVVETGRRAYVGWFLFFDHPVDPLSTSVREFSSPVSVLILTEENSRM